MSRLFLQNKRKYVRLDKADYNWAKQYKWHLDTYGYAVRKPWSLRNISGGKVVKLHREIIQATTGQHVDHINGNPLDNRRINLRIVTRSQQMWNKGISKNNKSGFKGVCLDKRRGTFKAELMIYGKKLYLGAFKTKRDAAIAYDFAAVFLFGEYARSNYERNI